VNERLRRLDRIYFRWLYKNVSPIRERNPSKTYWNLLSQLFAKEFVWLIPNDDNRAEDGRDLRREFLSQRRTENTEPDFIRLGCSMLEMLIGLSRRLAFETEGNSREWFWELIKNLELNSYNDETPISKEDIDEILDRFIWRIYTPNGTGGIFPLRKSAVDQRTIELWYQQCAYILENNLSSRRGENMERKPA